MTYRLRRQLISTKFKINKSLCKLFIEPWSEYQRGFWVWNVGFAVGKSERQLNDWYRRRKNKRRRSLEKRMTGIDGFKPISQGWKNILRLRWKIPPGDSILLDCTGGESERQFKMYKHMTNTKNRQHPEWMFDENKKEFYWTRPPYPDDPIWQQGTIIPQIPKDIYKPLTPETYWESFYLSSAQIDAAKNTKLIRAKNPDGK